MQASKLPVVAGLVIFVVCVAAYVILTILGKDTTGLLAFVGVAAGVGGFASWQNTETIKRQTNGPLTRMMEQVDLLVKRVEKLEEVERVAKDVSVRLEDKGI